MSDTDLFINYTEDMINDYLRTSLKLAKDSDSFRSRVKIMHYFEALFDIKILVLFPELMLDGDRRLSFASNVLKTIDLEDKDFYQKLENLIEWKPDTGFLREVKE